MLAQAREYEDWDDPSEIFRDIGENVTKLGSQLGGLADQGAERIRGRSGS